MHTEAIEYEVDGVRMVGHLAVGDPAGPPRPAILVAHEGPGLTDHARSRADRLAELGYVAFALDYHGGGVPLPRDEMMNRLGPLMGDNARIRRLASAGLEQLLARPTADPSRVGAIGFCFGGTMVLELARSGAAVAATVGFHSGLQTSRPEDARQIQGSVLVCIGADDPMISPESRAGFEAEMRAGEVDWRMNLYGGAVHSFTNRDASALGMPGIAYHEPTDRRSWAAMVELFEERFEPRP